MQKRGEPREVTLTKSILRSSALLGQGTGDPRVSPVSTGKWRHQQSALTCNDAIQRGKEDTGAVHNDRWRLQAASSRPVKAHLRRSASVPSHWCASSYQDLGQISDWSHSEWGAPEKHRYHSSRVFPPKEDQDLPGEPESRPSDWGVPHKHRYSSMPVFPPKDMEQSSGTPEGWSQPEWGVAEKHLYHSVKIFPPRTQLQANTPK